MNKTHVWTCVWMCRLVAPTYPLGLVLRRGDELHGPISPRGSRRFGGHHKRRSREQQSDEQRRHREEELNGAVRHCISKEGDAARGREDRGVVTVPARGGRLECSGTTVGRVSQARWGSSNQVPELLWGTGRQVLCKGVADEYAAGDWPPYGRCHRTRDTGHAAQNASNKIEASAGEHIVGRMV